MPANGTTDLDALNWGSGTAETTSTLGVDRLDVRDPPTQYHLWGAQITAVKNLAIAMSQYLKGGARLQLVEQSSNPFGAGEDGLYLDTSGVPYSVHNGSPSAIATAASSVTLTGVQELTNKTLTAQVVKNGLTATGSASNDFSGSTGTFKTSAGAVTLGDGIVTVTGTLTLANTRNMTVATDAGSSIGDATHRLLNTSTKNILSGDTSCTVTSAMADGASAKAAIVNTTTTWANAAAKLLELQNNGTPKLTVDAPGGNIRFHVDTAGLENATGAQVLQTVNSFGIKVANIAGTSSDTYSCGTSALKWAEAWSVVYGTKKSGNITAAATISPTCGIAHITGTTAVTTINLPVTGFVGTIRFIIDDVAGLTFNTGGNIAKVLVSVQNQVVSATYDGTSWYLA